MTFAAVAFVLLGVSPGDDDAIRKAVEEFRSSFFQPRAGDDARILAVRDLARHRDPRVVRTLRPLLARSSMPVRVVIVRELGGFDQVDGVAEALREALHDPGNAGRRGRGVRVMALRGLGRLKAPEAVGGINTLIADSDVWIAKAAVEAASRLRDKSSIGILVKTLRRLEGPGGGGPVSVDPISKDLGSDFPSLPNLLGADPAAGNPATERDLLHRPVLEALGSITRKRHASAGAWEEWWRRNRTGYKVPA